MDKCPKFFCFFIFVLLVQCQLYIPVADSAPTKFNRMPNEPNENNKAYRDNGYPSTYSGVMKNNTPIPEVKIERENNIAYAIPKRYIKWNIGNMDL